MVRRGVKTRKQNCDNGVVLVEESKCRRGLVGWRSGIRGGEETEGDEERTGKGEGTVRHGGRTQLL